MAWRLCLPALLAAAPLALAAEAGPLNEAQLLEAATAGHETALLEPARRLQLMGSMMEEMPGEDSLEALSNASMDVIGSMVGSFLADQKMTEQEKLCLQRSSQKFAGKIMLIASHVVMLIQEITGKRTDEHMPGLGGVPAHSEIKKLGADISLRTGVKDTDGEEAPVQAAAPAAASPSPSAGKAAAPAKEAGGATPWEYQLAAGDQPVVGRRLGDSLGGASILLHLSSILMELGYSIQLLVHLGKNVAKDCVHKDVVETLELAGAHMRDLHYMGGHFLANGADVIEEMSKGVLAYRAQHYSEFGTMMGDALHKVLLSPIDPMHRLPHGVAEKYMMMNISVGFVKGFFGKGFELGIKLDADPTEPMAIDLEECIANNMVFFEQIWSAVAYAYQHRDDFKKKQAVREVGAPQHKSGRVQLGTAMAVAAMELPDALHRCDIGGAQADMLIDSVKAFGEGMHLTLSTPNELASNDQIEEDVGQTIRDWHSLHWYDFGFDLGLLCQELVLSVFPAKYSVGDTGLLQRLQELGDAAEEGTRAHAFPRVALPIVALGVPLLLAAALRRDRNARFGQPKLLPGAAETDIDMEAEGGISGMAQSSAGGCPVE